MTVWNRRENAECREFEKLIPGFIGRKLDFPTLKRFYEHWERCGECREELSIQYKTVKTVTDPFADHKTLVAQLQEHQREHHHAEVSSRQCLSGPHKDDLEVELDGLNARSFASQGQTRTAALSLKLAAREIHKEIIGEYPILLLDDVLSELDKTRRDYLLAGLAPGQLFITCCDRTGFSAIRGGITWRIQGGALTGRRRNAGRKGG